MIGDSHGRVMRKLRLQLLEACDFRCRYCMPEDMQFFPSSDNMSLEESLDMVEALVKMGIDEIRLTGGEPTLHPRLLELVEGLSVLPLKKLGMTTNGRRLGRLASLLKKAGLRSVNISIDSLNRETFTNITRRDALSQVVDGIEAAVATGMEVKLNMVVLGGINDHELDDMIRFAQQMKVHEVRFLEHMKTGPFASFAQQYFIPAATIRKRLSLTHKLMTPKDNTAQVYDLGGTRVGIIASETESFCENCSRLRLSPKGVLRPCLFLDQGENLRGLSKSIFAATVQQVIERKPTGRLESISQPMNVIGG